jgi:hypothetical protein
MNAKIERNNRVGEQTKAHRVGTCRHTPDHAGAAVGWDRYFCGLLSGFLAASRGACASGR